jgi:tRNA(Arg) A34 adenosine deaminase TadA
MFDIPRMWERGFEAARAASQDSIAPRTARKVGAALFGGSILLALGHNAYGQSHPDSKLLCNIHAEHRALLHRQYYEGRGLVMYVFRQLASGVEACSRPCENCIGLMGIAGIRAVRFINDRGKAEEIKLS